MTRTGSQDGGDGRKAIQSPLEESSDHQQTLSKNEGIVIPVEALAALTAKEALQLRSLTDMFLKDPSFRKKASELATCHEQHRLYLPEQQPFRIMDLPLELRTMIFGYVLQSSHPIDWHWANVDSARKAKILTTVVDGRKVPANPLDLVSRQAHQETRELLYKVNDFQMYGTNANVLIHFVEFCTPAYFKCVKQVTIVGVADFALSIAAISISPIERRNPRLHVRFFDHEWELKTPVTRHMVSMFLHKGYIYRAEVAETLRALRSDGENRRWRCFPYDRRLLGETIPASKSKCDEIEDWIQNGI